MFVHSVEFNWVLIQSNENSAQVCSSSIPFQTYEIVTEMALLIESQFSQSYL